MWGRLSNLQTQSQIVRDFLKHIEEKMASVWWIKTTALTPPTSPLVQTLTGHSNYVNCVAVTPDGNNIISGSFDKTIRVWNLKTGQHISTLTGHSDIVTCVA